MRRSTLRRSVRAGVGALPVLLVLVWIASARWGFTSVSAGGFWFGAWLGQGYFGDMAGYHNGPGLSSHLCSHPPLQWAWDFDWRSDARGWHLYFPLWVLAAVAALPAAFIWWRWIRARFRARVGMCPSCGYDRTGLPPEAPCPECGTPAPKIAAQVIENQ